MGKPEGVAHRDAHVGEEYVAGHMDGSPPADSSTQQIPALQHTSQHVKLFHSLIFHKIHLIAELSLCIGNLSI